jgi:hypothetical protein
MVGAGLKPAPQNGASAAPANAVSIWDAERSRIQPHEETLTVPRFLDTSAITLKITTPLRLQSQGHPVAPENLRPRTLFTALLRRASLLFELHAGMPPVGAESPRLAAVAERLTDERALQWKDWTRFSSRQNRAMTLGGVIGEWKLTGDLHELLPWFWLGQWLHVGKETTMGMGMYSLEDSAVGNPRFPGDELVPNAPHPPPSAVPRKRGEVAPAARTSPILPDSEVL